MFASLIDLFRVVAVVVDTRRPEIEYLCASSS